MVNQAVFQEIFASIAHQMERIATAQDVEIEILESNPLNNDENTFSAKSGEYNTPIKIIGQRKSKGHSSKR